MASEQQQAMNPGVAPPEAPEPARQQQQQQQQRHPGRGGGRGQGRGRGQGIRGGRANHQQQGRGPPGGRSGPVGIAPTSGIPYGHVPAYLPGSSSLVEELDKRILMVLRDGRHLIGILRSFDQFSNLVLEDASERKVHRDADGVFFSDVPLGVYVVRGDSMVLLGQVAPDDGMKQVEPEELEEMIKKSGKEELSWDFDADLLA